ncbi:class I SAM-dependent methyltransferase, partial [Candidatus Pelagibacter sp.]|nr:class I SAM-dependent methyltransferase [Candidatus Pelagibacter sp.]
LKKNKIGKKYKTKILFCDQCITAYQKYSIKNKLLFPKNYHYRARNTKDVVEGMKDFANSVLKKVKKKDKIKVLDIGCNDGTLLNFFKKKGCKTYGIEPTDAYKDALNKGHKIFNCFFNYKNSRKIKKYTKNIDIITFTNVFAHIDNLDELLKSLKNMLHEDTIIVIENHYLGDIINQNQFDTFYHEHPRTYSLNSFLEISKKIQLKIVDVKFVKRYNGNIRVFLKDEKKNNEKVMRIVKKEQKLKKSIYKFQKKLNTWKINKKKQIDKIVKKYGPIPAKAFPGRAAIPINLLGLNKNSISAIYEKDISLKLGYLVPGTNIPILSDKTLSNVLKNKKIVVNFAWHIKKEINRYMKKKLKFKGKILNIISQEDF